MFALTRYNFTSKYFNSEAELESYVKSRDYENDEVGNSKLPGICGAFVVARSDNDVYEIKLRYEDSHYKKAGVPNRQQVPTTKDRVINTLTK